MFSPSSMLPGFATFSIGAERTLQEYGLPSSYASLSLSLSNTSCVLAFLQGYVQVRNNGGWLKLVTNRGQRKYCIYKSNKPLNGSHHIISNFNTIALQHKLIKAVCIFLHTHLFSDYPWAGVMNVELREWLFFPDFVKPPESYKIISKITLIYNIFSREIFLRYTIYHSIGLHSSD